MHLTDAQIAYFAFAVLLACTSWPWLRGVLEDYVNESHTIARYEVVIIGVLSMVEIFLIGRGSPLVTWSVPALILAGFGFFLSAAGFIRIGSLMQRTPIAEVMPRVAIGFSATVSAVGFALMCVAMSL